MVLALVIELMGLSVGRHSVLLFTSIAHTLLSTGTAGKYKNTFLYS